MTDLYLLKQDFLHLLAHLGSTDVVKVSQYMPVNDSGCKEHFKFECLWYVHMTI